jgi:hypothetical protein
METLQTIQTLTPATMMVGLLVLPWLALLLMHAVSAGSSAALDDKWNARAEAAVRWAGALIVPATLRGNAVRESSARRALQAEIHHVPNASGVFLHAA